MKSLGLAARGDAVVLTLADDDAEDRVLVLRDDDEPAERIRFDERDFHAALRQAVAVRVDDEMQRQALGLFGGAPAPMLRVEGNDGETRTVPAETLRAALDAVWGPIVQREVTAAVNALRGRVD
jgi:hypothetical protein